MSDYHPILQDLTAIADELAEVGDDALLAIKAGRRHSADDEGIIQDIYTGAQQIADLAIQLGATPDEEEEEEETGEEGADEELAEETGDALKMIYSDPLLYAQHECGDVMAACSALQALAQIAGSELGEDNPGEGTLPQITKAMRLLVAYVTREIDAIDAGGAGETKAVNYDQAAQLIRDAWIQARPAEQGAFPAYPQAVFDDAIIISDKGQLYRVTYRQDGNQVLFADQPAWQAVRQAYVTADGTEIKARMVEAFDTLGGATVPADAKAQATFGGKKRGDLDDSDFGDPKARKFPIMTQADVADAASLIGKADDPAAVKKRIIAIAKRKGFDIPDAWKEGAATKGVEFAVKMLDDDTVEGPAVWFGSPEQHDLSPMRDFFTKSTDYWLDAWDKRPMIWHHAIPQSEILDEMRSAGAGQDEIKAMKEALDYLDANPVVGVWNKATIDPVAVWMQGQVNKAHKYRSAVKRMIDMGLIKISTDSAPHLVRRERVPGGAHEVKRWPIIAASLTPTAAEPRLYDVQAMKAWYDEAGLTLPDAVMDEDEIKGIDFELELLSIEMEYAALIQGL